LTKSLAHHTKENDEKHSKSDSMDPLNTPAEITASTKTSDGAPEPTSTSPVQGIGSDKIRDESPKHHDHHKHHNHSHSEKESKSSRETGQDVTASTNTDGGVPGPTGTSPGQVIGSDESRDESQKHQDHHKHHDKSHDKRHPEKDEKGSGGTSPGVTASTKTGGGAPGPTGTSPGESIGSDGSRDESPKHHNHHKHHTHQAQSHPTDKKSSSETDLGVFRSSKTGGGVPGPTGTSPGEGIGGQDTSSASYQSSTHHSTGQSSKSSNTDSGSIPSHTISSQTSTSKTQADGFDGPNASFTSEIGSRDDPGSLAEERIYEKNAQTGDVGSMGSKQDSITGGGQFESLNREESA
jgi:hypothetical protein